jgi:predicted alpha/beta superfamily hydrolase
MTRAPALLLVLAAACAPPAGATITVPAETTPAAIGETFTIDSKILGERRTINVFVPLGSSEPLPVLYMPDGGMTEDFPHVVGSADVSIKNAVIRPIMIVGVQNTERRRDLVGPTVIADEIKVAPHAGGADKFRAFLRDELKPLIENRYRTTGESALIGESLAGLFVVETFLVEPTLFDSYIAASPSVWWNEQTVVRGAAARLGNWTAGHKTLYVATADEEAMQEGVEILTTALRITHPVGVTWTYEPMPNEHHSTIFPTAALHGIRYAFGLPPEE